MCDNVFDDFFGTTEMNIPTLKKMQMLKKKKKRRTREEIENDKKNENTSIQKVVKKGEGKNKIYLKMVMKKQSILEILMITLQKRLIQII